MATEQELAQALNPAFGIYPKAFRGNTGNPQDAANLPVDVMRGRTAGLLGMFGDVVNQPSAFTPVRAVQLAMQGVMGQDKYPDTEHFLKTLPLKPTSRAGEVAGQAASFVPLNPEPAVRAAKAGVQALGPTAANMAEGYMQRQGLMPGVLPAGGKTASKIDEITGLPLDSDGTVTLFHHTNKTAAEQIVKSGRLKSAGEPSVYLTTQKATDTGYGDVAVPVRVKPSLLNLDDKFPSGRMDFSISTGKPKGSIPVTVEKQSFQYPQDEAMRLAQQRAALPVEQGGLGLRAGNTAEQRAKAMGFDVEAYRGSTAKEISHTNPIWWTEDPSYANTYAAHIVRPPIGQPDPYSGNVMPLLVKTGNERQFEKFNAGGVPLDPFSGFSSDMQTGLRRYPKNDLTGELGGKVWEAVSIPENVRSRFAAFDPFRRNAAIAAAMGVAAPNLLASENNDKKELKVNSK